MLKSRIEQDSPNYIDTPSGIFTASGIWFGTTEEKLKIYARALPETVTLDALIAEAELWLRSPKSIGVWTLGILLLFLNAGAALLFSILVFATWRVFSPALVNRPARVLLRILDAVLLQAFFFVFVLSMLGVAGFTGAVVIGVLGFVLFRWDLVDRALHPLITKAWRRLYTLPVPDQVLRLVVLRAAMHHGVSMPELERMKADIVRIASGRDKV